MSDPQPARIKNKPPRAEPLQPDAPGRGTDAEDEEDSSAEPLDDLEAKEAERLQEQLETARKNVSEGYK